MPKKFRLGNVLLCDYAGKGNNNKHTLVNVYSGDVVVHGFPADLSFGIYFELLADKSGEIPSDFDLEVVFDGGTMFKAHGNRSGDANSVATLILPMFQFKALKDGALELVLTSPGYSRVVALSKRIYAGRA